MACQEKFCIRTGLVLGKERTAERGKSKNIPCLAGELRTRSDPRKPEPRSQLGKGL